MVAVQVKCIQDAIKVSVNILKNGNLIQIFNSKYKIFRKLDN